MTKAADTRDRILDAAVDLIAESGTSAVTLEAIAARAGVSKGGLLYHFPSKAAVIDGLAERIRAYTDANLARARRNGVVRTFLQTSTPDAREAAHYWAVFTAVRTRPDDVSQQTRATLAAVFDEWSTLLTAAVPDKVTADIIRLVGDGLYLSAMVGLPTISGPDLDRVLERLDPPTENRL